MAITDINISEQLETNAPSIKYRGNEGPKSPQEIEMMMQEQMKMAGPDRYFEILEFMLNELEGELGRELTDEEYEEVGRRAMDEFQQSGGQPLPQDPTKPVNPFQPKPIGPVLPDRQMAAYGGIMGMDGRRQYGLGSFLKKTVRKIIPNEVAEIAVKAAPFIAPFNPIAAGLAAGLGSFDQTGRMGSSIKSGLMNYGMGQLARGIGGGTGNLQTGFDPRGGMQNVGSGTFSKYFSNPIQDAGGLGEILANRREAAAVDMLDDFEVSGRALKGTGGKEIDSMKRIFDTAETINKNPVKKLLNTATNFALDNKLITGLVAGSLGASALMGNMTEEEVSETMDRGDGLDVEAIRAEVIEAYKDPSGEKLKALASKYPFLSKRRNIDVSKLAYGGRIGKAEGGLMDLGGMEKDYRAEGGFVPIGREEKADDVPARLSVNEFVFTADAVRNAGGGDIDKGAEVMENMMKNLEAGGQVSEESQGMGGAQQMFEVSERLSEVI